MIESRIKQGCNQYFHFIQNLDNELEVAKLIVGFSNSKGGELIIGVKENGKISGVSPADINHGIEEIIKEYIENGINYHSNDVVIGRHMIVRLKISPSEFKTKINSGNNRESYIRVNTITCPVNKIVKKAWAINKDLIQETEVMNEVYSLFIENKPMSLSLIYNKCASKNNMLDLIVAQLLALNKIELLELKGEIRYQLSNQFE